MKDSIGVYINPLTDFGFKYLFGREADKEFILSFLNALQIGGDRPVVSVEFIDKEKKGESTNDRAVYYLAADLYAQGEKGEGWDYRLTPVHGIFMMNFEWKGVKEQFLREDVGLFNKQTQSMFSDKLRMTFLKIPMMVKDADECRTTLERWMYMLKNMDKMETMPVSFVKDPVFERLGKVARFAALNEKEKKAYKESLKAYRDSYAIAATEREEGRKEGRAEGREEGRAEEQRNMIMEMLKEGISIEKIARIARTTVDKINTLLSK